MFHVMLFPLHKSVLVGQIMRVIRSRYSFQELEEAIIASGSVDGSTLLTQLFIQLLKGCYPHRGIT